MDQELKKFYYLNIFCIFGHVWAVCCDWKSQIRSELPQQYHEAFGIHAKRRHKLPPRGYSTTRMAQEPNNLHSLKVYVLSGLFGQFLVGGSLKYGINRPNCFMKPSVYMQRDHIN